MITGKKRPTQADVARLAGVSQAMVSYVINNSDVMIADETRQRIVSAMDDLGYVPNVIARRLRTNRTYTIASVIPDITNPFYPAFERGIQDTVHQYGYDMVIYNTDGQREREKKCIESLLQGRVDGIIGVFFHLRSKDLSPLIEQGIPIVRLEAQGRPPSEMALDNIYIDNVAASERAVTFLIGKGHRCIGMLTSYVGPARYREMGYRRALQIHGIECNETLLSHGDFSEDGGYQAMMNLLRKEIRPSAVFAANDLMAMGAIVAIREYGLSIPADIAVMGFDDIFTAKLVYPSLTTVTQFQRTIGQRAAEMVMERLTGQVTAGGRSVEMPFQIIERQSTERMRQN
jgi:LacI family transcriptional regulator